MNLSLSVMLSNYLLKPIKNVVDTIDKILPIEYNTANLTGCPVTAERMAP